MSLNLKKIIFESVNINFKNLTSVNIVKEIFPEATDIDISASGINSKKEKKKLLDFFDRNGNDSLFFIGEGGIGKTTTLLHLLKEYDKDSSSFKQIPIYIQLKDCSSNMEEWCCNAKPRFILKSVASIMSLYEPSFICDLDKECTNQLQKEFMKEPDGGVPEYLILLDGLNEVSTVNNPNFNESPYSMLCNEMQRILREYRNVRFIITSRVNNFNIDRVVKRIKILGLSDDAIIDYLRKKMNNNITSRVNTELLECLRIPMFLCMFIILSNEIGNNFICTRGEILREFFRKKEIDIHKTRIEIKKTNNILLDFIIPEIAWEMYVKDEFNISKSQINKIIKDIFNSETSLISKDDFLDIFCDKEYDVSDLKYKLTRENYEFEIDILTNIIIDNLAVMRKNIKHYSFKHQHFRDFFAAVHTCNHMQYLLNSEHKEDLVESTKLSPLRIKLNNDILKFISEYMSIYKTNPRFENEWLPRSIDCNDIYKLLDLYRNIDSNDECIKIAIRNLVYIINDSGMGLLDVDLSNLDLTEISFNGLLCGIDCSKSNISTNFCGSKVKLESFFPASHNEKIKEVCYLNHGKGIVTVSLSSIIVWDERYNFITKISDYSAGNYVRSLENDTIAISRDNRYIFSLQMDGTLVGIEIHNVEAKAKKIVNIDKLKCICTSVKDDCIFCVSKEKRILSSYKIKSDSNGLYFNEIKKRSVENNINKLLCSCDGNLLYAIYDGGYIYKYFLNTNSIEEKINNMLCVSVSKTNNVTVYLEANNSIKISGSQINIDNVEMPNNITNIHVSPDGTHLGMISDKSKLYIYDISENIMKRPLETSGEITSVDFSDDNKYVITCSEENFSRIWEIKSDVGICIKPLGDNADWIRNACYSPFSSSIVATSSIDGTAKIWDLEKKQLQKILFGHSDRVTSVFYNHEGNRLATTSDDCTTKIWNSNFAGCEITLKSNDNSVHNGDFSPDDKYLTTISWDSTGSIWDLEFVDNPKHTLKGHKEPILTVKYSHDGEYLVTSSNDNTAVLWDAKTGERLGIRAKHQKRLNGADFSPDGQYIITSAFDSTARIWKTKFFSEEQVLLGHIDSVRGATFNKDGTYISTVSRDMTGIIWKRSDENDKYEKHSSLLGHTFFVRSSMFSKENNVLTSSYDGTIREWDIDGNPVKIIKSVQGVFMCGCDLSKSDIIDENNIDIEELKEILRTHGVYID